jgi:hypothetical protein
MACCACAGSCNHTGSHNYCLAHGGLMVYDPPAMFDSADATGMKLWQKMNQLEQQFARIEKMLMELMVELKAKEK